MPRPESDEEISDPKSYFRCLTDPTRKSPRGPHRYAYTEEQFDRRLRDEAALPLLDTLCPSPPVEERRLQDEQLEDLMSWLGLSARQVKICRLRLEGRSVEEIAEHLKLSERRVWMLMKELKQALLARLGETEFDGAPGSTPYYGWQQVFLDSQKLK